MDEEFNKNDEFYEDLTECNSMFYSDNYKDFNEWFQLVKNKQEVNPTHKIPYINWFNNYLDNVGNVSVKEVKDLLRCLLRPLNRKLDFDNYKTFKILKTEAKGGEVHKYNPNLFNYINSMQDNESYFRIEDGYDAWEGITWVLDFLPNKPYNAVEALHYYLSSQIGILPDDIITGIEQSMQIILEKFVYFEQPAQRLFKLKPVEFELLIEELYKNMGYNTIWTKATRDGGKDIIADIDRYDGNEKIYIECKLYKTTKLEISKVGYFSSVIQNDKINRGIMFCTGYVSENLKNYDRRIQILKYDEIVFLLNAHLGINWCNNLDKIIQRKKIEYGIK